MVDGGSETTARHDVTTVSLVCSATTLSLAVGALVLFGPPALVDRLIPLVVSFLGVVLPAFAVYITRQMVQLHEQGRETHALVNSEAERRIAVAREEGRREGIGLAAQSPEETEKGAGESDHRTAGVG